MACIYTALVMSTRVRYIERIISSQHAGDGAPCVATAALQGTH